MKYTLTIEVAVNGEVSEQEVKDFIGFESGAICSIDNDNPLMDEDNNAEIHNIDIY